MYMYQWDVPVMADLGHRFSSNRTATAYYCNLKHSFNNNFFEECTQGVRMRTLRDRDNIINMILVNFYFKPRKQVYIQHNYGGDLSYLTVLYI